jgi:uncharacterized protein YdhG (YjbR/CyaY superfamily)
VRTAIRRAVPRAEEMVSYGMPTYKLHGRPLLYFAAWKHHYSVYPATARLVAAFKDELAPYRVEKGTIRFPLTGLVPGKLIGRIAKFRAVALATEERERKAKSAVERRSRTRELPSRLWDPSAAR